ncbi:hypothetical protein KJY73_17010 [Bowmanella sp. Y26]|uniref:hypothetical protein n=1 Tax=Bowmanella yangjiangensis TaxID=2811230 RepID=UPI001BDD2861|nr:hypothetical protein [Bowmanella yangjiangensis]MBT1065294.1 hypothetical protein [Bowmanella yangjiangensis]
MKSSWLVMLSILLSTAAVANPYNGNWYFVKGQYTRDNGEVSLADNSSLVAVKSVLDNKFSLTNTENGVFLGYLSGDFIVEGSQYSESIKEGTRSEHIGKTFVFSGWLEHKEEYGRTITYWHHKGLVDGVKEYEVWQKLE